jgi:hypothetical protein
MRTVPLLLQAAALPGANSMHLLQAASFAYCGMWGEGGGKQQAERKGARKVKGEPLEHRVCCMLCARLHDAQGRLPSDLVRATLILMGGVTLERELVLLVLF